MKDILRVDSRQSIFTVIFSSENNDLTLNVIRFVCSMYHVVYFLFVGYALYLFVHYTVTYELHSISSSKIRDAVEVNCN